MKNTYSTALFHEVSRKNVKSIQVLEYKAMKEMFHYPIYFHDMHLRSGFRCVGRWHLKYN